jgi:hypothetical protein
VGKNQVTSIHLHPISHADQRKKAIKKPSISEAQKVTIGNLAIVTTGALRSFSFSRAFSRLFSSFFTHSGRKAQRPNNTFRFFMAIYKLSHSFLLATNHISSLSCNEASPVTADFYGSSSRAILSQENQRSER